MSQLLFTGERLVPGVFGKIAVEHLHRYALTFEFAKGKKVLDIASGEGYGSNLLADYANQVKGVDISAESIFHAQNTYKKSNLDFQVGSVLEIPAESESFDLVVSFETIEHIEDHQRMISEIKRVLKQNGVLIISTPEKSIYSDQANYSNPFHEKELYESEFKDLLCREFQYIQLGYQKFLTGSFIQPSKDRDGKVKFFNGNFQNIDLDLDFKQEYLVAVCSNRLLEISLSTTFFNSGVLDKDILEEMVANRIKKIKSGFRYRLIDFLFRPWDLLKGTKS